MTAREIMKTYNATVLKTERRGIHTWYTLKMSNGIQIQLNVSTKKGNSSYELITRHELILPSNVMWHKQSGFLTLDGSAVEIEESHVIEVFKLNQ